MANITKRMDDSLPRRRDPRAHATCPTAPSPTALAKALLDDRLAACVNIGAPVESIYHWRGRIETGDGGSGRHQDALRVVFRTWRRAIRKLHPYDTAGDHRNSRRRTAMRAISTGSPPKRRLAHERPPRRSSRRSRSAVALLAARRRMRAGHPVAAAEAAAAGAGLSLVGARARPADDRGAVRRRRRLLPVSRQAAFHDRAGGRGHGAYCRPASSSTTSSSATSRPTAATSSCACRSRRPPPEQTITLHADSQGCADAGVCYPPNPQQLTLACRRQAASPGRSSRRRARGWFK